MLLLMLGHGLSKIVLHLIFLTNFVLQKPLHNFLFNYFYCSIRNDYYLDKQIFRKKIIPLIIKNLLHIRVKIF